MPTYSIPPFTADPDPEHCPHCGRPAALALRVRGVCPRCAKIIRAAHGQVMTYPAAEPEATTAAPGRFGFEDSGRRVPVSDSAAGDRSGEELLHQACADLGVNIAFAMQMLVWVEEHKSDLGLGGRGENWEAALARMKQVRGLIERAFVLVQAYAKKFGDREMAERCAWLLLDFPILAGAKNHAGLVRLMNGRSKQKVNKCLKFFQSQMPELPILPEQRDEWARAEMSRRQKEIWRGETSNQP